MARRVFSIIEIALLSALILAARCANYQEVFVGGNIYFTDADCYARMTRVRMCAEHPGLIVRHHQFENFPTGTTPHTTAPLDYLILGLSMGIKPLTDVLAARPAVAPYQNNFHLDLAGALISPFLALLGGWFLWWWSRRIRFRYRWALLILYSISPILVHGAALGRPDHQSLLMLLVTIAICVDWIFEREQSARWSILSGVAWALAIWVSAYEPLILFVLVLIIVLVLDLWQKSRSASRMEAATARDRWAGWISFVGIIALALLIEGRVPSLSIFHSGEIFSNWARSVGELTHVSPANPIWLRWCGYLLIIAPVLILAVLSKRPDGAPGGRALPMMIALLIATYLLTIWQARWAYFFVLVFALALPGLLEPIKSRTAVWVAFALSILPVLRDWDERLWPDQATLARRVEQRNESLQLRDIATGMRGPEVQPFLAPWWLSPSIAYWSGQPGVAGSSHESLEGIADSARFFLAENWAQAEEILESRRVAWVVAYDADRVAQNSASILGVQLSRHALCFVLDRTPGQAPHFLNLSIQNGAAKVYRVERKP